MNLSIGMAFLAGLASFLTPCVFSLVPIYVGYLSGRSTGNPFPEKSELKVETLTHGIAFVLGFSIIFVLLGAAASTVGRLFVDLRPILTKVSGVIVILFGLHMAGIINIPFLDYDLRPVSSFSHERTYISSALLGVFFSAGWSPCVGPVLGAILTQAASQGSTVEGVKLLSAYSAGLAVPFLFAAYGVGWFTQRMALHKKFIHYFKVIVGLALIPLGLLLFFDALGNLARFGPFIDFGI